MTSFFEQLKEELTQTLLLESDILLPPYTESDAMENKLNKTHRVLIRSIRTKNRKIALTNAYFLGLLLSESTDITRKFKKENSKHYQRIAESVFDIFEFNPSHILTTVSLNVQMIGKLKRNQVLQLQEVIQDLKLNSLLDRARNLEKESC